MVQMAWTFINDSLCTMICLQWEPEIVAIALMYLASRLGKCTITDWGGKKGVENEKWWDQFVEDLNVDVLEGNPTSKQRHVITFAICRHLPSSSGFVFSDAKFY